jgi:uncharacterized protein
MREQLSAFILDKSFPCVMAKSVINKGKLTLHEMDDLTESSTNDIVEKIYAFVDDYRQDISKLSSFILVFNDERLKNFETFEKEFWSLLQGMHTKDYKNYLHDPRVSSDPKNEKYSFSMKEEAFFILMLHPESPRMARRFKYPMIVFNPHQQFEELRNQGIFKKVRDLIRQKDKLLQGFINPMLNDFGEKSEVFQYTGKKYSLGATVPLFH